MASDKGQRRAMPDEVAKASDEDEVADAQPLSSRGVEEHRADPALRAALERLDAVRRKQPAMEEFNLERYMGRPPSADFPEEPAPGPLRPGRNSIPSTRSLGLRTCFSTDLLLAVARQPARRRGANVPPSGVGSRSTSPGSALESSTSGSIGGFSSSSVLGDTPPARLGGVVRNPRPSPRPPLRGYEVPRSEPAMPPGVPPQRPGRRPRRSEDNLR